MRWKKPKKTIDEDGTKKLKRNKKPPKISKTVLNIIPIKTYDEVHEYYIYKDGTIMNIFQIICKDLTTTNAQDIEMDILQLTKFLRLYSGDMKIISINIPTDCKSQIDYYTKKIEHCKNDIQKRWLIKNRNEQIWIEKNRLNKEFYLQIFASSPEQYEDRHKTILNILHQQGLIILLDKQSKNIVLYKMNNKNLRR